MPQGFTTNPTQLTGLLSFIAATIACLLAARRSILRDARTWYLLAFANFFFLIEICFGLRLRIHERAVEILKTRGIYNLLHGSYQKMLDLVIVTIATIFVILVLTRCQVGGATRLALSLTVAVLALFAIETVSLHAIDAIFYRPIGPVLTVGWLWAITAAGICLAATRPLHGRNSPRPPR
jgi:hypothetical protein